MKEQYHHGDLRRSLIEKGVEFISREGEENLSLRKVAMECGVSNAAPYAHFKNKDEFIAAIQQHIMALFTESLEKAVEQYKDSDAVLPMLGKAYVMFFYRHPLYFDFLFSRKNIRIQLSLGASDESENPPLNILKKTAMNIFSRANIPQQTMQDKIIAMWALVQGLSSIVTMPNVEFDDNWEDRIEAIIKSITLSYQ
ncbi:MAG: TetR/AcrR family transcriptional regulator [Clostridiales bacterium]|nr:TetR/AcrR family transcriptional regulator [Clostridiales bacterium]